MGFAEEHEQFPIREDTDGVWRVGPSRVSLDLVLLAFDLGGTPEEIIQQYPSLALADVYGAISWCLRHRNEVDTYLQRRDKVAAKVRASIEQRFSPGDLRTRLLARRPQQG